MPETYCFTLSIAMAAGLYTLGFDLGAVGARIQDSGSGEVMPLTTDASEINNRLLLIAKKLQIRQEAMLPPNSRYERLLSDYYELNLPTTATEQMHTAVARQPYREAAERRVAFPLDGRGRDSIARSA